MKQDQPSKNQEWFNSLPRNEQKDIIKSLLDHHLQMVVAKMSALASLSALSATMIVVATLNKELINLDNASAKIILSILISLIPLSLLFFFIDVERGAVGNRKQIESYIGKVDTDKNWLNYITSYFPFIVTIIYFLIVIYLLYIIW